MTTAKDRVIDFVIQRGPVSMAEITDRLPYHYGTISRVLSQAKADGVLCNVRGVGWAPPGVPIGESPRMSTETIECRCGCGETRLRFDDWGRERFYVYGHGTRAEGDRQAVLDLLRSRPGLHAGQVGDVCFGHRPLMNIRHRALTVLRALEIDGLVTREGRGVEHDPYRWRAL